MLYVAVHAPALPPTTAHQLVAVMEGRSARDAVTVTL